MKKLLSRLAAGSAASIVAVAGFASFASASPYSTEGPDSPVTSWSSNFKYTDVENENDVEGTNNTDQDASSGHVHVYKNTTANNVSSGDASNDASFTAEVSVDNSASSTAALESGANGNVETPEISTQGPDSPVHSSVHNKQITKVENDNKIEVTNNVDQKAETGNVSAVKNSTVGSVSSGDASNTSTSSMTINVTN